MSELKRCPFCGGEVKLHISELDAFRNVYSFLCNDCDMEITYPYSNEEEAIKAWNTRKPMQNIVERLENFIETDKDRFNTDFNNFASGMVKKAIEIVKEEGGLHGRT